MTQKQKNCTGSFFFSFPGYYLFNVSTLKRKKEKNAKRVLPTFFYLFEFFWESSDLCVRVYVCVDPRIPFRLSKCLLKDASDILVRFTSTSNMGSPLHSKRLDRGSLFLFKERKNTLQWIYDVGPFHFFQAHLDKIFLTFMRSHHMTFVHPPLDINSSGLISHLNFPSNGAKPFFKVARSTLKM